MNRVFIAYNIIYALKFLLEIQMPHFKFTFKNLCYKYLKREREKNKFLSFNYWLKEI